ncbi:hypothetical protein CBR_g18731 [Chara braunii]|uniref:Uncharacterized protein n=1 Tax=Chara braunii TaxID=69332 RepID=A0A388KW80_CHABU|nr:hypothetical protein CBR_g18731 [Chara braunii]|eukprot:GBG74320.1 hypothetical protein CBR_g18731 [Chara braunii]
MSGIRALTHQDKSRPAGAVRALEPTDKDEEDEIPNDEVELLIVQAWRTNTGEKLLGLLFGKVGDGHLEPITNEVLVFLAQLLDNLPLDIISRCDKRVTVATLTRTLVSHLLWSMCTELDGDNCYYPSSGHYVAIDVSDLTLWDPIIRRVEVEGVADDAEEEREGEREEEEDEDSEAETDNPDYHESEEIGLGRSGSGKSDSPSEQSKEEDEVAAQRRRERAEGKRSTKELDGLATRLTQGDPARNPKPPHEESGGNGVTTADGFRSRRHKRSPALA